MRPFLVASVKNTRIDVAFMQGSYLYNNILGILVTLPSQTIKITAHATSTKNPLITTSAINLIAPAVLDAEAADPVADAVPDPDPELEFSTPSTMSFRPEDSRGFLVIEVIGQDRKRDHPLWSGTC
jgi:hypothetical protein